VKLSIALLGWGSLIWDPGALKVAGSGWRPDGPLLPIEYLRASGLKRPPKRLTLVLVDRSVHTWASRDVRALWTRSVYDTLEDARTNLAQRERSGVDQVGYLVSAKVQSAPAQRLSLTATRDEQRKTAVQEELETWLEDMRLDATIWADLSASADLNGMPPTAASAMAFLWSPARAH
jgi:hypothetical protein